MEIREYGNFQLEEITNSLCVIGAYDNEKLVGIIRAVGDGLTIVFIQDIIIQPEYQRKGIGTKLLKAVMDKYSDVYQMELLTDNTEKTKAFYRSVGFSASDDMGCVALCHHRRRGAVRRYVSLNAYGCLTCSLERSRHIGH